MTTYFEHFTDITTGKLRLVDLRSPGEFAQGAMPHAINIPLFSDDERALVGTTYKQVGQIDATQLGLEIVAAKMPTLIDRLLELAGPEKRIAVHCWRGGMRSGSVAKLLEVLGIKAMTLSGGYKAYRNQVLQNIRSLARHKLLVLNGRTGSGKTQLIHQLIGAGAPVIDLEGLAKHRGSALGHINIETPQPSQQQFENELANAYFAVRQSPTIILEIEQNIGKIQMPQDLREHIYKSEMVLIERDLEQRVEHIASDYAAAWSTLDDEKFSQGILLLKKHLQGDLFDRILAHVKNRELHDAIRLLIVHRYDKCYDKAIKRQKSHIVETIHLADDLTAATKRIMQLASIERQTTNLGSVLADIV